MVDDNKNNSIEKLITKDEKHQAENETKEIKPDNIESIPSPEDNTGFSEQKREASEQIESNEGTEGEGEIGGIVKAGNIQQQKSKQVKGIEDIMSDDLKDTYLGMPTEKRAEFKRVGEETAIKINELLEKTKVKVKKVIKLLKKWLSLIPGANKYFIEQRAKIKSDEIIALKDKQKN